MGDIAECSGVRKSDNKPQKAEKRCLVCWCSKKEKLDYFKFQCSNLREIFQMDAIWLCYLCKRIAQHTESFIQCVQANQISLKNSQGVLDDTIKSTQTQKQPLVNLKIMPLQTIDLSEVDSHVYENKYTVITNSQKEVNVKIELKGETWGNDYSDEEMIINHNEYQNLFVKVEGGFAIKTTVKQEKDHESTDKSSSSEQLKTGQGKKKANIKKEPSRKRLKNGQTIGRGSKDEALNVFTNAEAYIKTVYITREQCLEDRESMKQDWKYLGSAYKCVDCVKGFNLRPSFENHMLKHSETAGQYECDICNLRMESQDKVVAHMRYHFVRYQCKECGITRICRNTIKDHYTSKHSQAQPYICNLCTKAFKRSESLKRHKMYSHNKRERVSCTYCQKTYATKEVLRAHLLTMHTEDVTTQLDYKKYVCGECGMAFQTPSQLRTHATKHSDKKEHYCVECNKSFKTITILKTHLKTAAPHVTNKDLPFPCLHCDKRFKCRQYVELHANKVHFNIKPYQCDSCDKAYASCWSLKKHKTYIHDGLRYPLRHPCHLCDKIFSRPEILKNHLRTHTGEKPFQCDKCPASFSQSSILKTHERLVHLKQTRDGQPRNK